MSEEQQKELEEFETKQKALVEEKEKHRRKSTGVVWSSDSAKFAMVRSDMRKVADLWVVHAVGNDRCAAQPSPLHTPPFSDA